MASKLVPFMLFPGFPSVLLGENATILSGIWMWGPDAILGRTVRIVGPIRSWVGEETMTEGRRGRADGAAKLPPPHPSPPVLCSFPAPASSISAWRSVPDSLVCAFVEEAARCYEFWNFGNGILSVWFFCSCGRLRVLRGHHVVCFGRADCFLTWRVSHWIYSWSFCISCVWVRFRLFVLFVAGVVSVLTLSCLFVVVVWNLLIPLKDSVQWL